MRKKLVIRARDEEEFIRKLEAAPLDGRVWYSNIPKNIKRKKPKAKH